ncbi:RDD family protein [Alloacidobacterium dinghuense]|uniref:RDD family protein n=1 Tax=Alloacidobacterium dinghuense TaxID=2763107 RepID=A0A7G8BG09_9BACT|nr:RDD family protein [Alloacidobacterium dinghuense]QNI31479.1 RDD family protein [Alloacidobacterium dinghuense]
MSSSTSKLQFDSASAPASWKDEVNARLAAHRTRRTRTPDGQSSLPGFESGSENTAQRNQSQATSVAARVAERYAKAPTYSEILAAQAAAARAAEAAAEAAVQAHAAAQAVLAGLEMDQQFPTAPVMVSPSASEPIRIEPIAETRRPPISEIVDPFEEATVIPTQPLPAKLIEFPRELIATRKARPRLAEGPLREEAAPDGSQLRIFEVEAETISKEPVSTAVLPEWHSIRLDAKPREEFYAPEETASGDHRKLAPLFELPLQVASIGDRIMAGIVDVSLVMVAFLLFVLVFVACTAHPPMGRAALAGAGGVLFGLFVLYQWLFFSYLDATPGMRYARIALCTFEDENPARKAMRYRVGALLLSAMPLGLGFLWSFFDEDHLGWHDRITRTYQRSYR